MSFRYNLVSFIFIVLNIALANINAVYSKTLASDLETEEIDSITEEADSTAEETDSTTDETDLTTEKTDLKTEEADIEIEEDDSENKDSSISCQDKFQSVCGDILNRSFEIDRFVPEEFENFEQCTDMVVKRNPVLCASFK